MIRVLSLPRFRVGTGEQYSAVDMNGNRRFDSRRASDSQPRVGGPFPREDEHQSPGCITEHSRKCEFIGSAGVRASAGMGVDPDPGELIRAKPLIDLLFKQVPHGNIIE